MNFNWFGDTLYVPMTWWMAVLVIAIFIFIVCAIGGAILSKNLYACPECGFTFKKNGII